MHCRLAGMCIVAEQEQQHLLYAGLKEKFLQQEAAQGGFTAEALHVGRSLRRDFEKAGIHLPDCQREHLTHLIGMERRIGMQISEYHANLPFALVLVYLSIT